MRSPRTIERHPQAVSGQRSTPAFEFVESKLARPFTRKGVVPRPALVERLLSSIDTPVVTLLAPPGYGKTTVLHQWAEAERRRFAWVSLDRRDNDPAVLLTYVALALDRIEPIGPGVYEALASPRVSIGSTLVPRLGAAVSATTEPFVLVMDDVHLLRDRDAADALTILAHHLPAGSQLAIAGRDAPAVPIARLRADGRVLEIGTDELSFDGQEAASLMRGVGVSVPRDQLSHLMDLTEGWPVGLYLAALSIEAGGPGSSDAPSIAGADRSVADYFRSELLRNLSRRTVAFLTRTSVLHTLSGQLCDAVLERTGSVRTLESIARRNLLLLPLDRDAHRYRYHHLFREMLRAELDRREPAIAPRLLRRAADWCEEHGLTEDALDYAQEAGDADRAARLLPSVVLPAHNHGRLVAVRRWLAWFDERDLIEPYPTVAALGAGVLALMGDAIEAERWAAAAEPDEDGPVIVEGGPVLADGVTPSAALLAMVRATMLAHGTERLVQDAGIAREHVPRGSPWRATALLVSGISHILSGDDAGADVDLLGAVEAGEASGSADTVAVALCERAIIAMAGEQWSAAQLDAERARSIVRRVHLDEYVTSALVHAVTARIEIHEGDPAAAHKSLVRAQRARIRLTYAIPWLAVQVRLELARAYRSLADPAGARTVLREVDEILRRRPDLGVLGAQLSEIREQLEFVPVGAPGMSTLTAAELRLFPYLSTYLTFPEIGERLFLSRHTVKTQAISIYRKLGVSSRREAIERARELGLIDG